MLLAALLPCLVALVAASPVPAVPAVTKKGAIHLPAKRHSHSRSRLVHSLSQSHLRARDVDPCSENGPAAIGGLLNMDAGLGYLVDIEIDGTPLSVVADTGSPQLWVPASNCTSCKAAGMQSLTNLPRSNDVGRQFFLQYGTGNVTGLLTSSSGSIDGLSIDYVPSGAAYSIDVVTAEQVQQSNGAFQGIMGLAPRTGYDPTIPELLYRQGSIASPQLGFFLGSSPAANDSELTIGDVTQSKWYSSAKNVTLNQTAVGGGRLPVSGAAFYSVILDNVAVGTNVTEADNTVVIMDTGTTVTLLPEALAHQTIELLFGSAAQVINGTVVAPCDFQSNQAVSFGFGGQQWPMKAENVLLRDTPATTTLCVLGIQPMPPTLGIQGIMGDTFLRNVYSVYNFRTMGVELHALPETSAGN